MMKPRKGAILLLLLFLSSFVLMAASVPEKSNPANVAKEPDITVNINGDDNDFSMEVIDNRIKGTDKVLTEEEYKEFMYLLSKVMQDRDAPVVEDPSASATTATTQSDTGVETVRNTTTGSQSDEATPDSLAEDAEDVEDFVKAIDDMFAYFLIGVAVIFAILLLCMIVSAMSEF